MPGRYDDMKLIENILTPQIKSKNVSYKETISAYSTETALSDRNLVKITNDKVEIFGTTEVEIRQGINYIEQLKTVFDGKLPVCEFEFYSPAYQYRGFMIDVCRHFMSVKELKRIIKMMGLCGYNFFHWHLTEDQAWRFEVEGYDKLKEISCKRVSKEYFKYDMVHEGIYSDDDLREIVDFCADLGITVIPEIEIPGHATALLAAYPEFGCTGNKVEVETRWGIFDDVMNPASEELWTFLEKAFSKLASIFPGPYFHIGGDECPYVQWEQSEEIQNFMKQEGIQTESELQGWCTTKASRIVASLGKRALGWDEVVDAPSIDPSVVVMSWRGFEGAEKATERGHNVILCPQQGCYLDKGITTDDFEPSQWGVYYVKDVLNVDIGMRELPEEQRKLILGAQCNVWCEQMHNGREVEYMMFPKVFAYADNLWLGDKKNWDDTKKRKDAVALLCYKMDILCSPARWEE